MEYSFGEIEKKWQEFWLEKKIFKAEPADQTKKPKFYVLDMFPYPSGNGLHVGHPEGYTATDIMARYKRMKGFNVLHPMGWDSFGLPAENHAIKTGTHPHQITETNIKTFKRQLQMLGFSYDWDREIATSHASYYKWTQWIFLKLYEKGLAYESEMSVNWCPILKTVLANEEVVNGKSEVGGHPVIRKPMKQWMLKITQYAERLLEDLELLDWPNSVKEMQKVWIGKSEGATITFQTESKHTIEVFTTRADTLFGSTYLVLAPEHHLVDKITTAEQKASILKYQDEASKKSDLERTELNKNKSGTFTGSYAVNPITKQKLPIYIADYILATYGTGAIMAVPAHDERDFEFAQKFNLPIIKVVEDNQNKKENDNENENEAYSGDGKHINSDFLNGLNNQQANEKMISYLEQNNLGRKKTNYKLRDWLFSRQRYWGEPFPLIKWEDGTLTLVNEKDLPVTLPEVEKYEPSGTGESPLATIDHWLNVVDPVTGKKGRRETNTMPQWAGSCWYYLRFIDPTNNEKAWDKNLEKYWMPVDLYIGGAEHAVLHLLYARFWHKVLYDLGLVSTKEPFQKLVNQGMILGEDGEKMSKSRGNVINPDSVVVEYGADTLRLYEMFMGPLEKSKPWSMNGVKGVFSFLQRACKFFGDSEHYLNENENENEETLKLLHKTIKKVTSDIDELKFNTCISTMMIFTNHCIKIGKVKKETALQFSLILSPFAPHLGEELFAKHFDKLHQASSLTYFPWPTFNEKLALDDEVTYAVQISGKTRFTENFPMNSNKEDVMSKIKNDERLIKYIEGKEILKEIFVPNKIVNIVVK